MLVVMGMPYGNALSGLSESFEVEGWVVKVSSQSRDILFEITTHKEMPSRGASRY